MHLTFSVFVFLIIANGVHMHICLWSPMQRGEFDISTPGAHPCYRKIAPCGNINASSSSPRTSLVAGGKYNVEFQQNLNHYYTGQPGTLDISFAVGLNPSENDFHVLHSFSDYNSMNQITQTNFSIEINLPNEPCDECILRVRYLSNNPEEEDHGTIFHQCSDIKLTPNSLNTLKEDKEHRIELVKNNINKQRNDDPHDCCIPESYVNAFFHSIPAIDYRSEGLIFYDKKAQQMRVTVTVNGGRGNTTYDSVFDMWMNFTSGYQYYFNRNTGKCDLYGLDYWNDWCFGNKYNQSEDFVAADIPCSSPFGPSHQCNQWRNGEFLFETYASDECLPSSISRPTGERTNYVQGRIGPISPSTFVPNPACLKQTKIKHASPRWMKFHF
ncbi:unnamed protein product [Rotaria sp. Silwood2]|nr:unnamed protein product [Rotaria sp. Silwood2]CAF2512042.1 unnamed protein product [Rotaria sp. Silwood2]CAF2745722.1 unnamed protein product [Rotaria sp. Silwood2]CAF3902310.1 unnamed protein product [Rotaria sp. Silwood2]CAF3919469.1 unnamed protein product [Rotaria sp. Silwood2]